MKLADERQEDLVWEQRLDVDGQRRSGAGSALGRRAAAGRFRTSSVLTLDERHFRGLRTLAGELNGPEPDHQAKGG